MKLPSALVMATASVLVLQACGTIASTAANVDNTVAAASGASLRDLSSTSSHQSDTTTHDSTTHTTVTTTHSDSHSSDDHEDCEAPYSILKCNLKIKGKTLAEYGDEFWKYIAGTDNTRIAFQLNTVLAEQYMLLNMPEPVLLLGGLFCTAQELLDNPDACNGVVPTPITRKRDVPLADFKFVYVPVVNFAQVADPGFCFDPAFNFPDLQACKDALLNVCFDDTVPTTPISFIEGLLDTDGALTSSVNGNTVAKKKLTLTTDSFLVDYVDPDARPDFIFPASPKGLVDPPFYACDGAVAYMIEVKGPGTLVVEFSVNGPPFFVGPITYELTFV